MVNKQQTTSKEHFASVKSFNLPISSKFAMEIASNLRNKDLKSAKRILQDSISLKRAIKFKKFTMDLAHKAGMAAGRYAVDACKQVLELLDSVEANAEFKGLDVNNLIITKIVANKGPKAWHYGRKRRRKSKRAHLEIIVEEKQKEKQDDRKTIPNKKN
ncbi:MAG TPA: 50S ribosomal protein L22 [Candidatus Nanoarchaeia archaeon]|nr:hypothetical protein [uncultured archaeon]AQS34167.1 hypothetical protein [uncultured archaeon]HLC56545.1 50S ribosomal protein L22 [Candidatus Nanoarchaeia archaeon]